MKYIILNYANEQDYASGKIHPSALAAYDQAIAEAGVMIAAALNPAASLASVEVRPLIGVESRPIVSQT